MPRSESQKNWSEAHRAALGNRRSGKGNEVTRKEKGQMQTLRNQGKTIEEIALEMNRSYATVTRHTYPRRKTQ